MKRTKIFIVIALTMLSALALSGCKKTVAASAATNISSESSKSSAKKSDSSEKKSASDSAKSSTAKSSAAKSSVAKSAASSAVKAESKKAASSDNSKNQSNISVDAQNAKQQPVQSDANTIYLTFDDGPSSTVTPEILDILEKNDVKATFFIVDYSQDKIPLLKRMIADGDTIGIHTINHDYSVCYANDTAYLDGVNSLSSKLEKDTGYKAFCIRFPGGSSNTVSKKYNPGVMARLVAKVNKEGLTYYDWNVSSGDAAKKNVAKESITGNVKTKLNKNHENIVLMHDTDAKKTTAAALQSIIDYGKSNGYTFSPISPSTAPIHHKVNN